MVKTAIVYASTHHNNTYKLVKAIREKYNVDLIDATAVDNMDLSEYELIGFASGIDFGRFYDSVEQFLENNLPPNKKVFFIYTCAKTSPRFTQSIKEKADKKDAILLGEYGCKGFNTYGPWKLVGGMNKNHPDTSEIKRAVQFFESVVNKLSFV